MLEKNTSVDWANSVFGTSKCAGAEGVAHKADGTVTKLDRIVFKLQCRHMIE